jgi:hypothetical protein
MLTLFSTLISFLMGGLPKLLDFFQDRSDKKHELALAQLQIERELEMRKLGFEAQERVEHIHTEQLMIASEAEARHDLIDAQKAEMQAIYAHDASLNEGTSQWMKCWTCCGTLRPRRCLHPSLHSTSVVGRLANERQP